MAGYGLPARADWRKSRGRSASLSRTANGTITCHPKLSSFTISRNCTKTKKELLAYWLNPRPTNRKSWHASTGSIGQPRRSPSTRSGLRGAAPIRPIGPPPLTRSSNGSREDARWLRAKKASRANTPTWRSSLAEPSGWRHPMDFCVMPRSPGAAPARSGS